MSIVHLEPENLERKRRRSRESQPDGSVDATGPQRERLLSLVTQLDGDRLEAAAEALSSIVEHQRADTRGLTESELSMLERFGVSEEQLRAPSSLSATRRSRAWARSVDDDTYSVAEVAVLLGVTAARIRQRCAAGSLLARRRSDGWYLPRFQFPDGRELRGWSSVAAVIPRTTPLLLAERVLGDASPRLVSGGESLAPLEWLAEGGDPELVAAAVDDALNRLP